ncbi:hypothetical protein [Phreatobacter cathodiphilus]|uniref:hypothetical protein n=1 Tax=Phreatobacter cathodiphilus TaxID=1868589 RepID=UPI0011B29373|nr:hypothetical protein [Phreatobacter cathodiphilus]
MMLRRVVLIAAALMAMGTTAALAESPSFCNQYASKAVHDARQARSNPRCNTNLHAGVFSTDFNVHYNWCLRVDRNRAYAGTDQREGHLRRCSVASGPGRPGGPVSAVTPPPEVTGSCRGVYIRHFTRPGPRALALGPGGCSSQYGRGSVDQAVSMALMACGRIARGPCRILETRGR